jgi:hypothetical protein
MVTMKGIDSSEESNKLLLKRCHRQPKPVQVFIGFRIRYGTTQ